jgi:hypothetical protein
VSGWRFRGLVAGYPPPWVILRKIFQTLEIGPDLCVRSQIEQPGAVVWQAFPEGRICQVGPSGKERGCSTRRGMNHACLYLLQGKQVDFWLESSEFDNGEEDVT